MLIPKTTFAGQVDVSLTSHFPQGAARGGSSSLDPTATPWCADLLNDWWGFQQSVVASSPNSKTGSRDAEGNLIEGVIPNGIPDSANYSQLYTALLWYLNQVEVSRVIPGIDASINNTIPDINRAVGNADSDESTICCIDAQLPFLGEYSSSKIWYNSSGGNGVNRVRGLIPANTTSTLRIPLRSLFTGRGLRSVSVKCSSSNSVGPGPAAITMSVKRDPLARQTSVTANSVTLLAPRLSASETRGTFVTTTNTMNTVNGVVRLSHPCVAHIAVPNWFTLNSNSYLEIAVTAGVELCDFSVYGIQLYLLSYVGPYGAP